MCGRAFDENAQHMIERLLQAKLPLHLKRSPNLAYQENIQPICCTSRKRVAILWFGKRWGADKTYNDSHLPR